MTNLQRATRRRVHAWPVASKGSSHRTSSRTKAGTFKGRPETSESECRMRKGVGWPHRSEEVGEWEGTQTQRSKGVARVE